MANEQSHSQGGHSIRMTTYAVERERFLRTMQAGGMAPEIARRILRHANTVQRLSVLACNGDRRPYVPCPASYAGREELCLCDKPDCDKPDGQHEKIPPVAIEQARAKRLIREWCDKACLAWEAADPQHRSCITIPFSAVFGGDPRGACVRLEVPSGKTDDWGREGICVPTRRY
jgi:hypothetical protein